MVFSYLSARRQIERIMRRGGILFFFPCYHVGGAEKVHFRISQVAGAEGKPCSFIFTERSESNAYLEKFSSIGTVADLSFRYDNKRINDYLTAMLIKKLNKTRFDFIFTSNSRYFYGLLAQVKTQKVIDLVHAYNPPFEIKNLDFSGVYHLIHTRIFINDQALQSMKEFYKEKGLKGIDKFRLVYNSPFGERSEPAEPFKKTNSEEFNVIFVARNSPEKRPAIAFELAQRMLALSSAYRFHMVGNFSSFKTDYKNQGIIFHDDLKDAEDIIPLYKSANAIILTSETEGFPLVLSEAMFFNVVPVTTNVGGISGVVKNNENGLLIDSEGRDSEQIILSFVQALESLKQNPALTASLGERAFFSAKEYFGCANFKAAYKEILS